MTKQEYQHIRNLAWDLLIDAKISSLSIDIFSIAKLYNAESYVDETKPLIENTILVSEQILNLFGYKNSSEYSLYLAIRIMSPMIILKSINVKSAKDISAITKLPLNLAEQRYERYKMLLKRNSFNVSSLETRVLNQFQEWLNK